MEVTTMNLAELVKPDKNIRIHTEQQIKEFERSIEMFGQIRPIIVDEDNVILAGNGLYDALLAMGRETADVCRYENLTENQKRKLMIADNRIYALGVDNLDAMNDILGELVGDLDVPGFDEEMLKQMMADEEEITEVLSEYGKLDGDEIDLVRMQAEKKDAAMQRNAMRQTAQGAAPEGRTLPAETALRPDGENMPDGRQEMQRSVICPKCGARICL